MTVPRTFPPILLFGPGTAILPPLPVSAPPARAAKVKGGAAGARWRALPLTEASTLAAIPPVGGVAALVRKCGGLVARRSAAKRTQSSSDQRTSRRGDRYADDSADIRLAACRAPILGRNTALSRRARAVEGRYVGCVARGSEGDGIVHAVCCETADPGTARPRQGRSLRGHCRAFRGSFRARSLRGSRGRGGRRRVHRRG